MMRIERIQLVESNYFQHSVDKLERERKKTHTDQAISFEDKRSDKDQLDHQEKEPSAEREASAHEEQEKDLKGHAFDPVGISRVNVVV